MANHKTLPRLGQYAAGGVLIAVAVTSGIVSLTLNAVHGFESSLATSVTFILADVAKISLPLVCGLIGWTWQTRLTLVACALVSLMAAASFYLDTSGQALLNRQHAASVASDSARQVAELESDRTRAQALADAECKAGRGPRCREYLTQAREAADALSQARKARAGAKPAETSGLAVLASMASGTDETTAARWVTGLKALLAIVLLESLVYLSIPGCQMIATVKTRKVVKPRVKAKPALKLAAVR
jgi:hypothetical protein